MNANEFQLLLSLKIAANIQDKPGPEKMQEILEEPLMQQGARWLMLSPGDFKTGV